MPLISTALTAVFGVLLSLVAASAAAQERIVSADGAITEIIFALDADDQLAGVDTTSHYPPDGVAALPKVGYLRALPLEGVLSLQPTRLITTTEAGPAKTIERIRDAGVQVVQLPVALSADSALERITNVGQLVHREAASEKLVATLRDQIDQVKLQMQGKSGARVLFLLAAGDHGVMLAGTGTSADALLTSLGLVNAVPEASGYKPASREALLVSSPDAIMVAEARPGQFREQDWPALTRLPAWQNGHRLTTNAMFLLGFGPRLADAMKAVADIVPAGETTADAR